VCGIAGVVSARPLDENLPRAMLSRLRHRGPDDEGIFLSPDRTLGLVHTRLSILDLSSAGHQPMSNEDQTLWITYNGEVYNFQELRRELEAQGHSFRSRTDTEVLLRLYEKEGEEMVQRLTGMFAFCIYDRRRNRLFLARDRLGIKPLYYAEHAGNFLFASEIKALLAAGLLPVEVDWQAVWDYFTFSFVPHPETAFRHIRQLPPAHTLTLDLRTRGLTLRRYWNPWPPSSPQREEPYEALREQVRGLCEEAVRGELVSDVPLGLFFSGGIDSTLLAALMMRHSGRVKTFTVTFRGSGAEFSEDSAYARFASKVLGTDHHELVADLEKPEQFLKMIELVDQPFGNATVYLQRLIAKATRQEVTVALSGVGGDELFGGYPKYRLLPWAPLLRCLPQGMAKPARRFLGLAREAAWAPYLRRAKRLLRGAGLPLPEQYLRWSYSFDEEEKRALLPGIFRREHPQPSVRFIETAMDLCPGGEGRFSRVFAAEIEHFLADNLLEYTDKATMAVALETRVPFLNHKLVELSARIPFRDKIRWGTQKHILVDAFRDLIPREIAEAPKRGFSPPMDRWMAGVLDRYFDETLNRHQIEKEGIFSWDAIRTLRIAHRSGRRDASFELTAVLMFDVWYRRYILKSSQLP